LSLDLAVIVYVQKVVDHAEFFRLNHRLQTHQHIFYLLDIYDSRVVFVTKIKQLFWGQAFLLKKPLQHLDGLRFKTLIVAAIWVYMLFSINFVGFQGVLILGERDAAIKIFVKNQKQSTVLRFCQSESEILGIRLDLELLD